jgi:hypothetical protein
MQQLENKHGNTPCSNWNNYQDRQNYNRMKVQLKALEKKQDYIIQQQTKKQ